MVVELGAAEDKSATVPLQYNELLQAALYHSISPELSSFLHDQGFLLGKRSFKLFTFSRLLGQRVRQGNQLIFASPVTFQVASPLAKFIRELASALLTRGHLTIGMSQFAVRGVEFPKEPAITSPLRVNMLGPLTVYSTLHTSDGHRKTYYYSPQEREFARLVDGNLKRKALLLSQRAFKTEVSVEPAGKVRETVVLFKRTVVKGWVGSFSLKGPETLLRIGYDTGLGSKNCQGFGMFEVVE
jgi:CRISPR-associated endoribonuclease Cas6